MKISYDSIIGFFVVAMFSSIYILFEESYGGIVVLAFAGIIFLLCAIKNNGQARIPLVNFHLHVFIFAIYCFISSIWAWEGSLAISMGVTITEILICYSLIYSYFERKDSIDSILRIIMWSGYIVSIYALFYYGNDVIGMLYGGVRLKNAFNNVNVLGILAAVSIVINLYYILNDGLRIWDIMMIPATALLLATGSRKGLIALVVGFFLLYSLKDLNGKKFLKILFRSILAIAIIVILIVFLSRLPIFYGINKRMEGLLSLVTNANATAETPMLRSKYIKIGMKQFAQNPILGIGIGNSGLLIRGYFGYETYLHNNFVELLACGGIVGFIFYYFMYLYIIIEIIKYRLYWDREAPICIILILLQIMLDYGSVSYYSKSTYFFLMVGYLYINLLKRRKEMECYPKK